MCNFYHHFILQYNPIAYGDAIDFYEEDIQFNCGDVIINGKLLVPNNTGPHPAIIMIHGAGRHAGEEYRAEAEIFAKSGIAAFIYDKRTDDKSN